MNLLIDDEGRARLLEFDANGDAEQEEGEPDDGEPRNGVRVLIDVLLDSGNCNDWGLAGMVCKTLWNFSEGVSSHKYASAADCFGVLETEVLTRTLTDFVDEDGLAHPNELVEAEWQHEFATVGTKLLQRINERSAPAERFEVLP